MPHITTAMHRSVRKGVSDIVFDSLLGQRSIIGDVDSVKSTFSSWDNCMAKTYCKWPVIIVIVVVSLVLFSILWCIIRCACCGMSCCCTCFSFLKCCDCCGGCCDGRKDKQGSMKHLDEPYAPQEPFQNRGYQAPAPMMTGGLGGKTEAPQYAQFEIGKSGLAVTPSALSEDALPPMPSWDSASKKHVMADDEKDAVELGDLDPTTGQKVPLMTNAASPAIGGPSTPAYEMDASPFGPRPGQGVGNNGYMGVAQGVPKVYDQNGYRGPPSPGPGRGMGGPDRGYSQFSPINGQGRGFPPSPQNQYANDGFGGPAVGYGRAQPQRQETNGNYGSRQYPPQPQSKFSDGSRPQNPERQYSDQSYGPNGLQNSGPPRGPSGGPGPGRINSPQPYGANSYQNSGPPRGPSRGPGPDRLASPPLVNNAGFDFGSDGQQSYSQPRFQPQQMPYGSRASPPPQHDDYQGGNTAPPSYASRSPPPAEPSYPGYRPYQPANQGNRTPGGRAPPHNWDPVQR